MPQSAASSRTLILVVLATALTAAVAIWSLWIASAVGRDRVAISTNVTRLSALDQLRSAAYDVHRITISDTTEAPTSLTPITDQFRLALERLRTASPGTEATDQIGRAFEALESAAHHGVGAGFTLGSQQLIDDAYSALEHLIEALVLDIRTDSAAISGRLEARWQMLYLLALGALIASVIMGVLLILVLADRRRRVRSHELLAREADFEDLMVRLSKSFINCPLEDLEAEMHAALEQVGRFAGADIAEARIETAGDPERWQWHQHIEGAATKGLGLSADEVAQLHRGEAIERLTTPRWCVAVPMGDRPGIVALAGRTPQAAPIEAPLLRIAAEIFSSVLGRRDIQRALVDSEGRLRLLVENIREVFWISAPDGVEMQYLSPAFRDIWGVEVEEAFANPGMWSEMIHEDDRARMREVFYTREPDEGYDEEYRIVRPDGSVRWIRDRARPIRDTGGSVLRLAGIAEDITEYKRAEHTLRLTNEQLEQRISQRTGELVQTNEQLRREIGQRQRVEEALRGEQELLRAIMEIVPDCVYFKDVDGRYTRVNRAMASMLGLSRPEDALGLTDFEVLDADDAAAVDRAERALIDSGHPITGLDQRATVGDGEPRWFSTTKVRLVDDDNQPIGLVGISRDVTAARAQAETLRQRDEILEAVAFAATQSLGSGSWEDTVQPVLERLGLAAQVSRVYLFKNERDAEGRLVMSQRAGWTAQGIAVDFSTRDRPRPYEDGFERWERLLSRGEVIHGHARDCPESERPELDRLSIVSVLVAPINVDGEWWGYIGFDDCQEERIWAEGQIDALRVAAETLGAAIRAARDERSLIDARDRLEERVDLRTRELAEAKGRLDSITNTVPGAVYQYRFHADGTQSIPYISKASESVFGVPPEAIVADFNALWSLILPEEIDPMVRSIEYAVTTLSPWMREFRVQRPDGEVRWIRGTSLPREPEPDGSATWNGLFIDITDRRAAEEATVRAERRFRQLADNLEVAFWLLSPDETELLYVSPAYESITGEPVDCLYEDVQSWHRLLHPDDRAALARAEQGTRPRRDEREREVRLLRRDGSISWIWVRSWPVLGEEGEVLGRAGIAEDITTRKEAQLELEMHRQRLEQLVHERTEELEHSLERLRVADRWATIGTLTAGLGHDMNHVLFPLRCRLPLPDLDQAPADVREFCEAAQVSVTFLQQLCESLSMLATDPDDPQMQNQSTALLPWWNDTRPLLSTVVKKSIHLCGEIGDDLPDVRIASHRLTRSVLNLLVNAAEATADGGTITVGGVRHGDDVLLRVTDTGVGMPEEVRMQAFDPFFTTKTRGVSTGLGLSLVRGLVESAGGEVEIESIPGRGTTVQLRLPVATATDDVARAPRWKATLSVHDDRVASFLRQILTAEGYDVSRGAVPHPGAHSVWITEADPDHLPEARRFLREETGRLVVLGDAEAAWHDLGAVIVARADDLGAVTDAIRAATRNGGSTS